LPRANTGPSGATERIDYDPKVKGTMCHDPPRHAASENCRFLGVFGECTPEPKTNDFENGTLQVYPGANWHRLEGV